ncbi:MAG: DUF429 domain-containing protein [Thermoleophilia bacterium]|nr:DUF429 domain-containing protein [Thermoleophilia bacterium]
MEFVAGIDVGGTRKGSHVAMVDLRGCMVEPVLNVATPAAGIRHLLAYGVTTVVIDAPRRPAPNGERSRSCERSLRRSTGHGIFWTPDAAHVADHYLQDWLVNGFAWFEAAVAAGLDTEEGFPSAAFAHLDTRRAGESRAAFTTRVTADVRRRLGCGPFAVRGQDERDALCAAWIARACRLGDAQFAASDDGSSDRIAWVDAVQPSVRSNA